MMSLHKYIAKKFWVPFFFSLGVFATLVVLGDMFEKMKNLGNGVTTIWDVLSYSLAVFPNWLTTIMPIACLLGAISVISEMVSNGEWTASIAGGFSPKQLFKPIIVCILLVVVGTMFMQEFVVPPLNAKADFIYYTRLKRETDYNQNSERQVSIKISASQMLFAKEVNLEKGTMDKVSFDIYGDDWAIKEQIVADQLFWDNALAKWVFKDALKREFIGEMDLKEEKYDTLVSPITIAPNQMSISRVEDEWQSLREMTKKISFYKQIGLTYYSTQTIRQARLAAPFVTVIMCLLGMPFAISSRRKSKILNIIISIVIAFSFWWIISMCTSIGKNGYINPFLAGWGPVVIFSIVLIFEFKWMRL